MAAVADAGQRFDAALDELRGRAHVDHLGRARIADGPSAAHEQQRSVVDAQRGIIDVGVIILGSIEHHRASFEGLGILRVG